MSTFSSSTKVGNRRFRICIENHLDSYINSKTRQEKTSVISSIVDSIQGNSKYTGGFIAKVRQTVKTLEVNSSTLLVYSLLLSNLIQLLIFPILGYKNSTVALC